MLLYGVFLQFLFCLILGPSLMDLPTELLESGIFPYLTRKELKGIRLNKRLKDIADSVIEKKDRKRNYKSYSLLHGNAFNVPCFMDPN